MYSSKKTIHKIIKSKKNKKQDNTDTVSQTVRMSEHEVSAPYLKFDPSVHTSDDWFNHGLSVKSAAYLLRYALQTI